MLTTLFLIIAFFRRRRFLSREMPTGAKVIYYILNVALTPVFGPWLFKMLNESKWVDRHDKNGGYDTYHTFDFNNFL